MMSRYSVEKASQNRHQSELTKPDFAGFASLQVRNVEEVASRYRRNTNAEEVARRMHGTALDCATINATVMSMACLRLYRAKRAGGTVTRSKAAWLRGGGAGAKAAMYAETAGEVEEVNDHPVLTMLRRPNPKQTGSEWTVETFRHKWLFGNALMMKLIGSGQVVGLVNMFPQFVRVQPDEDDLVGGYWYGREATEERFIDADGVIHTKFCPSLHNPYWGEGPLERVIREMDLQEYAIAAEISRWQRGGYPGGHLSLNEATGDQVKLAREEFRRRHVGADKTGDTLITTKASYTPFANAHEMEYVQGMEYIDRRIEQAFGVPESLRRLNEANLASSLTGNKQYIELTIGPALAANAEQWTELLLPEFGVEPGEMWFAYDELSAASKEETRQDVTMYVDKGVWTINDALEEMGFDGIGEAGDVRRYNGVPLDKMGQMPAGPSFSYSPSVSVPPSLSAPATPEPSPKAVESVTVKSWGDLDPYAEGCCGGVHTKDDDRLAEPDAIAQMRTITERWLREQAVRVSGAWIGNPDAVTLEDAEADLARELEPIFAGLFQTGAESGVASVGDADEAFFGTTPEGAVEAIQEPLSLVVEQIRGTTEDGIRSAISQVLESGASPSEAVGIVRESVADSSPARAEMIARTETANAYGMGAHAGWKAAGVTHKEWLLAPNACPICTAMAAGVGGPIPIDEPFAKAGETIIGTDGRNFTVARDVMHEPLHPRDRCTTLPVTE